MIYEPIWGAIIAWYLFLAGLGGGAFATAVFVRYRHPDCKRLMRVGRLIAPIVVIIGLCLLMFDATAGFHNPLRFVLLLTNFGSVMTWGVVFLAVFVVVALIVLVLDLMKREVPMWLDCVGLVMGLCVAIPMLMFYYYLMLKFKGFHIEAVEHSYRALELCGGAKREARPETRRMCHA